MKANVDIRVRVVNPGIAALVRRFDINYPTRSLNLDAPFTFERVPDWSEMWVNAREYADLQRHDREWMDVVTGTVRRGEPHAYIHSRPVYLSRYLQPGNVLLRVPEGRETIHVAILRS